MKLTAKVMPLGRIIWTVMSALSIPPGAFILFFMDRRVEEHGDGIVLLGAALLSLGMVAFFLIFDQQRNQGSVRELRRSGLPRKAESVRRRRTA
jgi:hypothetical protein